MRSLRQTDRAFTTGTAQGWPLKVQGFSELRRTAWRMLGRDLSELTQLSVAVKWFLVHLK